MRAEHHCDLLDPAQDGVREIWEAIGNWHSVERLSLTLKDKTVWWWGPFCDSVERTKERILKAAYEGDVRYLENFLKAVKLEQAPFPYPNSVCVTIYAFEFLYCQELVKDPDAGWPTWQEVRAHAEQMMRNARHILPVERQWPRTRVSAGLSGLLSVRYGKARRLKVR